jgi:hypothetical protein
MVKSKKIVIERINIDKIENTIARRVKTDHFELTTEIGNSCQE